MQTRIGTEQFNTETAQKIGNYEYGAGENAYKEVLYHKKTGGYFLHCTGGPESRYGEWVAGSQSRERQAGERIDPLSNSEADAWAKAHLDEHTYAKTFARPSGEKLISRTFQVPESLDAALDQYCKKNRYKKSAVVSWAIEEYLQSHSDNR